jgi:hypothetical protein
MIGMDRRTGARLSGLDHLAQSLGDILSTPLGSRVCRRNYGSILPELLDRPMTPLTRLQVFAATATAIARQERRVRLTRVALEATTTAGAFVLRIIGATTDAPGRVLPFDFALPVRALGALTA